MRLSLTNAFVCSIWILPLLCGCGGDEGLQMATVSGTVKLDGQPLPGAMVTFVPAAADAAANSGSSSIGVTDADGRYELQYSSSKAGAVLGTHTVRITTHRQADEDDEGNPTPAVPEKVPAEYNVRADTNPDMKREIKSGSNEINFDLKSGGQIFEPPKSDEDR